MNAPISPSPTPCGLDVEAIAISHLRQHLAAQGYPESDQTNLRALAIRAANAAFRAIKLRPRRVEMPSPPFVVAPALLPGFTLLCQAVQNGEDLTPFQSKLRLTNADFHDHLLTDWGIHHFHLGALPDTSDSRFMARTGPVLYAYVEDDHFLALGVDQHGHWADPYLLEILHKHWPQVIAKCRAPGQVLHPLTTEDEIKAVRKTGINGVVQLADGTVYRSPNIGRVTDGTPVQAIMSANQLVASVRQIQKHLDEKFSQLRAKVADARNADPSSLSFEIAMVREGAERAPGFWLDEVTTGYSFYLQGPPGTERDAI